MAAKKVAKSKKAHPEGASGKSKKSTKKGKKSKKSVKIFKPYIIRVLKQVHTGLKLSRPGVQTLESFIIDVLDRIGAETKVLMTKDKVKPTMNTRDIQAATKIILPGELAKHAISEGSKAVTKFNGA